MKKMSFRLIKIIIIAIGSFLLVSIGMDVIAVIQHYKEIGKVNRYAVFEISNFDRDNRHVSKSIDNQIIFLPVSKQDEFRQFSNVIAYSPKEIEDKLAAIPLYSSNADDDPYNVVKQKHAIINSETEAIALMNEKMLLNNLLNAVRSVLEGNCNFYICNRPILRQTITNDSTYFGSSALNDRMSRYQLSINDTFFELTENNLYRVPEADTLRIDLINIENRVTYLDTTIIEYDIVKVGNRWRELK